MIAALDTDDKRKGAIAALLFVIGVILFMFLVKLTIPDPPLQEEILELEVDMGSSPIGGNSGSPQENVMPQEQPEQQTSTEEIETQDEESVYVPSSDGNQQSENTQTNERQPDSQWNFGNVGDGGSGNGEGGRLGDGDGDGGTGGQSGSGDGGTNLSRKQLNGACIDDLNSQLEGTIALDIWVGENGRVVRTQYNESKSNTGNEDLIRLAQKATKCMRYEDKPGTGTQKVKTAIFRFKKQ